MTDQNLAGLRVLTLEARRAREICRLIENYGGVPISAPAVREVPLSSNEQALRFAEELMAGKIDIVIFLTGVGARALAAVVETAGPPDRFLEALRRTKVVVRGPKPAAVMREWNVPIALTAPDPSTWHEIVALFDQPGNDPKGQRIGVQEYGVSNSDLIAALEKRGASVTRVPVYQWALPEDPEPLRDAVRSIVAEKIDVALFTSSVQAIHLFEVAREMGEEGNLKSKFESVVIASIGPATSDSLRDLGVRADLEASPPKMGFLVRLAAEKSRSLLDAKR